MASKIITEMMSNNSQSVPSFLWVFIKPKVFFPDRRNHIQLKMRSKSLLCRLIFNHALH